MQFVLPEMPVLPSNGGISFFFRSRISLTRTATTRYHHSRKPSGSRWSLDPALWSWNKALGRWRSWFLCLSRYTQQTADRKLRQRTMERAETASVQGPFSPQGCCRWWKIRPTSKNPEPWYLRCWNLWQVSLLLFGCHSTYGMHKLEASTIDAPKNMTTQSGSACAEWRLKNIICSVLSNHVVTPRH